MASVEKRTRNGKVAYVARWRDASGKSRSQSFGRKVDADRHAATVAADLARGSYVDGNAKTTVAEYARSYIAAKVYRPTTRTSMETWVRNRLEATPLGARPLVKVRPSEIQVFAASQVNQEGGDGRATGATGLAPLTLRIQLGYLRSMFAAAVLDGLISSNPVPPVNRLSLPKSETGRFVPLTVAQVHQLADEMPEHARAMVLAQAGLGLRLGELLALRVQDVNFLRREVKVEHQLELRTLRRVAPKTPQSRRTVPLAAPVAEVLAAHIAAYPPEPASGLLFNPIGDSIGRPRMIPRPGHDHAHYGRMMRRAVKRAGLPAGTSSHDLRHHYASVLVAAGESVFAVAERLGHTNATLVLSTYGHLMPGSEDSTRRAIETAWAEAAGDR